MGKTLDLKIGGEYLGGKIVNLDDSEMTTIIRGLDCITKWDYDLNSEGGELEIASRGHIKVFPDDSNYDVYHTMLMEDSDES